MLLQCWTSCTMLYNTYWQGHAFHQQTDRLLSPWGTEVIDMMTPIHAPSLGTSAISIYFASSFPLLPQL